MLSIEQFESARVDPDAFDHAAHVHMGWLYVHRFGLTEGSTRFADALRRLTRSFGAESKYHETITLFFMMLIAERSSDDEDFFAFRRRNTDLFENSKGLLKQHYSDELLASDTARQAFHLPDLVCDSAA